MLSRFSVLYRRYRRRWYYPILTLLLALGICVGSPQVTQAINWFDLLRQGVQVIQLSNISDKQEVQLGQQMNEQLSSEVRLYRNPDIVRYVNQIGRRLAASSDRPNIAYTFQVVDDDGVNAFATTGGFVYVHTGLLKLADNEAELASVLGHEIGHITGKHLLKQMREMALAGGVATAAGIDSNKAVQIGVELALRRPNSRRDEFDADQRGLRTIGRAGYAESAMISFMEKLLKQGGSGPSFLSTHPATKERIAVLRRDIDPQRATGEGLNNATYKARMRSLR